MHTIDTKKFNIRTDLIIEQNNNDYNKTSYEENNILVENLSKESDLYTTITYKDITDKENYQNVLNIFHKELDKILSTYNYKNILVIGLGNNNSTPDALGPEVINKILVTRYLFSLGEVEEGYKCVSTFKPGVFGTTGIESSEVIKDITKSINADLVIIIDSLAASNIKRVNKVIQITNTGISPGSGVSNNRGEINYKTLNVPVIGIGVPTIVDLVTVVSNTFNLMIKKLSFTKYNKKTYHKLITSKMLDYSDWNKDLSQEEKTSILGLLGNLNEEEFEELIEEILIPIDCNLMVTPKEIDFFIEKISSLISTGINKTLHKSFNTTK